MPRATTEIAEASLEELMCDYVDGSSVAFDTLYARLSPTVFGYLMRLTRHRERAEDLLQVTFIKIHRARASYLRGAPLRPWVYAIARRSFYDERRAAKSRPEFLSSDGTMPDPPAPEGNALPTDTQVALEAALNRMPNAYREAIQLTKLSGLSIAEAADVLGATPMAVKLRVHRGYKVLRGALGDFRESA